MPPETSQAVPNQTEESEELMLMPQVGRGCPFLGLDADGSIMLSLPSPSHRCFAAEVVRTPRTDFQQSFCLGSDHIRCATYQAAANQPIVHVQRGRWQPTPQRNGAKWLAASAVVLLALLTGGALIAMGRGGARSAIVDSPNLITSGAFSAPVTPTVPTAPTESTAGVTNSIAAEATIDPAGTASLLLPTPTPARIALVSNPAASAAGQAGSSVGGATLTLNPLPGEIGWWRSGDQGEYALGDSYLNAGQLEGDALISAMRFSLRDIPRGAPVLGGSLALAGLKGDRLNPALPATWLVELISERELNDLSSATFMMVFSAPNSVTLPVLRSGDLSADGINRLELDSNALRWLEQQRLADAESVTVRIVSQVDSPEDTLYAWDSGAGPKSLGRAPALVVRVGDAPPTPPLVPTEDMIVATFTPAPQNVVTLVAQQATATFIAQTVGTYTPVPPFATPTPYALSLPTAQAIARQLGLPAVVIETPVPANEATATALVEYATAVALTTGTFTPVPEAYVTPMLVVPPLPAELPAENERILRAALADSSLPYNAVIGAWVAATPTPQNVATAAALSVQATADAAQFGPATATPWGQLVFTPVPPPLPTATPTTPLVQSITSFTPTPDLAPTATPPSSLPADMLNRVIFLSDRFGNGDQSQAVTLSYDPATGNVARINAKWAKPLAEQILPFSPDGQSVAVVHADGRGLAQVFVRSLAYGSEKQITNFDGRGDKTSTYDPAWSPRGDWIAVVSNNSGNDEIYRVSPDGSIIEQLTFNSWEWDKHPTWSPDGSKIVFFSNRDTKRKQLWVMNADGSGQQPLLTSDGEDWDPVWTR